MSNLPLNARQLKELTLITTILKVSTQKALSEKDIKGFIILVKNDLECTTKAAIEFVNEAITICNNAIDSLLNETV